MIRRPPRSTLSSSSAASDVYKRQGRDNVKLRADAWVYGEVKSSCTFTTKVNPERLMRLPNEREGLDRSKDTTRDSDRHARQKSINNLLQVNRQPSDRTQRPNKQTCETGVVKIAYSETISPMTVPTYPLHQHLDTAPRGHTVQPQLEKPERGSPQPSLAILPLRIGISNRVYDS